MFHEFETKHVDVKRHGDFHIADEVSDNGHVSFPDGEISYEVRLTFPFGGAPLAARRCNGWLGRRLLF